MVIGHFASKNDTSRSKQYTVHNNVSREGFSLKTMNGLHWKLNLLTAR